MFLLLTLYSVFCSFVLKKKIPELSHIPFFVFQTSLSSKQNTAALKTAKNMVKQNTVVLAVPLTVIIEDLTNVDKKNNA